MTAATRNGTFPSTIRAAAEWYLGRNCLPVPVEFRTKKPTEEGWEALRLTAWPAGRRSPPAAGRSSGGSPSPPGGPPGDDLFSLHSLFSQPRPVRRGGLRSLVSLSSRPKPFRGGDLFSLHSLFSQGVTPWDGSSIWPGV
jgi:hypothetical protein